MDPSYLHECFLEKDNKLYWKIRPESHFGSKSTCRSWNGRHAGKEAGTVKVEGQLKYRRVHICETNLAVHRVLWIMRHNKDVPVDHVVSFISRDHEDMSPQNLILLHAKDFASLHRYGKSTVRLGVSTRQLKNGIAYIARKKMPDGRYKLIQRASIDEVLEILNEETK